MLGYYAEHFRTVEINYTFRRMPTTKIMQAWVEQVPKTFQFSLKAPQAITHFKRLRGTEEEVQTFLETAAELKDQLGPILFQLPPTLKIELERLDAFLKGVARKSPVAFEFRHESWFIPEVIDCLRSHGCALCLADTDEIPCENVVATTDWGYVRLRRDDYTDAELRKWIKQLQALPWKRAYVYFKHEDTGNGPKLARRFMELAGK
jgi:uncharacterized protein YecE (DUF72 family)